MARLRSRSLGSIQRSRLIACLLLHPAMPTFARQYKQGNAAVVHAVATSYRERSHFDGQDVLESGFPGAGLGAVPAGSNPARGEVSGKPSWLSRRGPGCWRNDSAHYVRSGPPSWVGRLGSASAASEDLAARVLELYAHRDPGAEERHLLRVWIPTGWRLREEWPVPPLPEIEVVSLPCGLVAEGAAKLYGR